MQNTLVCISKAVSDWTSFLEVSLSSWKKKKRETRNEIYNYTSSISSSPVCQTRNGNERVKHAFPVWTGDWGWGGNEIQTMNKITNKTNERTSKQTYQLVNKQTNERTNGNWKLPKTERKTTDSLQKQPSFFTPGPSDVSRFTSENSILMT